MEADWLDRHREGFFRLTALPSVCVHMYERKSFVDFKKPSFTSGCSPIAIAVAQPGSGRLGLLLRVLYPWVTTEIAHSGCVSWKGSNSQYIKNYLYTDGHANRRMFKKEIRCVCIPLHPRFLFNLSLFVCFFISFYLSHDAFVKCWCMWNAETGSALRLSKYGCRWL